MREVIERELRVAFSRKAQPTWFRIAKWLVIAGVVAAIWGTPGFWYWIGGAAVIGIGVHLFWRWKTKGWTQRWGGWDDIDAGKR